MPSWTPPAQTVARRLVASGINKSSRVGLLMENGIEWAVTATAIMRIGAVLVPLSTLLKPPELHHQLQTAAVTELIVTREFRGRSYLSDLETIAPGCAELTAGGQRHVRLPNLRGVWAADDLPASRVEAFDRRAPSRRRFDPPTTWSFCSPPEAGARPRASSTPMAEQSGRLRPVCPAAASVPMSGSTSPCRSFGPGDSRVA